MSQNITIINSDDVKLQIVEDERNVTANIFSSYIKRSSDTIY